MKEREASILITEDDPLLATTLVEILKADYKLFIARSGEDALEKMTFPDRPDLILLDIIMPGISGYEVCRRLKENKEWAEIPVIFISALSDASDIVKGFTLGGVDYVTKPFKPEEVKSRIKTHVTLRKVQKNLADRNSRLQEEIQRRREAESALTKMNEELETRVAQRTVELARANTELEQAKKEAESASRAKTEFLSNISHELRTPLSPIVGMVPLILMDETLKPDHRNFLETIRDSADKLADVIKDLIDLSTLEAEGLVTKDTPFSIKSVINNVTETLLFQAEAKGLTVGAHIAADIPDQLMGDSEILEKILARLGENAVKFTEQGQIDVLTEMRSQDASMVMLKFSVKDTGIGIPADKLENIFQDFTQADGSSTRQYGGLGLGLTMVKRTITLLSGTIGVDSIEGEGSTFYFTLSFRIPE